MPLRGDVDDELRLTPREVTQLESAMNRAPRVYMEGWTTTAELGGLYKLAVEHADMAEILTEALAMLRNNRRILSAPEREKLAELRERTAALS
jgi:hypothetical protein